MALNRYAACQNKAEIIREIPGMKKRPAFFGIFRFCLKGQQRAGNLVLCHPFEKNGAAQNRQIHK
jgi:hypothetical protein